MNQPVNHQPIVHQPQQNAPVFPTAQYAGDMNAGVVAIESQRAVAEAQGQIAVAKRFPRNTIKAMEDIRQSCSYPEFAEEAFYALPRGGQIVRGPSIRLAEELARVYCNFQYGHREIQRSEGESLVEVYAWDVENNNRSTRQITIPHIMDTKSGGKKLTGQKEIADYIANVASKQMRSRILALLPKPLVALAIRVCEETLAGRTEATVQQRVEKMMASFAKYGVNSSMMETYLGHPLTDVTTDEITDLISIFAAIKEGASPKDYFSKEDEAATEDAGVAHVKAQAAKHQQQVNTTPTADPLTRPQTRTTTQTQKADKPQPEPQNTAQVDTGAAGAGNEAVAPAAAAEKPKRQTTPRNTKPTPDPKPEPQPDVKPEVETKPEPQPDPEPQPEPQNEPPVDDIPPPEDEPDGATEKKDWF